MRKHPSLVPHPRFTSVLLLLLTLLPSGLASQEAVIRIRFDVSTSTLGAVMDEIRRQANVTFVFDSRTLDRDLPLQTGQSGYTISEAIGLITTQTGYTCLEKGDYIVINSTRKSDSEKEKSSNSQHYTLSDPSRVEAIWADRSVVGTSLQPDSVKDDTVRRDSGRIYPAPYSRYTDPDLYAPIARKLPHLAVKTNLLYGATALSPNLSGELGISPRITVETGGSWNRFNRNGARESNKKLNHWIFRAEVRSWLKQRYDGHFVGVHAFYSEYNISQHKIPLLFDKQYRYEGNGFGAGITYGYHLPLAKRWGVEFHAGLGAAKLKYDKYDCTMCGDIIESKTKTYFGPSRAGVSMVFIIR